MRWRCGTARCRRRLCWGLSTGEPRRLMLCCLLLLGYRAGPIVPRLYCQVWVEGVCQLPAITHPLTHIHPRNPTDHAALLNRPSPGTRSSLVTRPWCFGRLSLATLPTTRRWGAVLGGWGGGAGISASLQWVALAVVIAVVVVVVVVVVVIAVAVACDLIENWPCTILLQPPSPRSLSSISL